MDNALCVVQIVLRRRYRDGVRTYNRTYSVTSVDSIALNNVTKSRPNSGIFNPALDLAPERQMVGRGLTSQRSKPAGLIN